MVLLKRNIAKMSAVLVLMSSLVVVSGPPGAPLAPASAATNPIADENAKAGTSDWQLGRVGNDDTSQIKGYVQQLSYSLEETIDFHVSVSPPQAYKVTVYRMGYYQGLGGRYIDETPWVQGTKTTPCSLTGSTGHIKCTFDSVASASLEVGSDWTTGVYMAKLTNAAGFENHIPFVVRESGRRAPVVYQQPVTTYHAYNLYPDDNRTGKNTYNTQSYGPNTIAGTPRAVEVSFDRPLANRGSYHFFLQEHELIMFLEEQGYDMAYVTDLDTHLTAGLLDGRSTFLSAGHDEYWTSEMFERVSNARDSGVNLAFFGANAAFWRIRFEDANRTMAVYKDWGLDPVSQTVTFRELSRRGLSQTEQQLVGIQYITYGKQGTERDFVANDTSHWIYNNTGMRPGDRIPDLVGGEVDVLFDDYPKPLSTEYTVLGESPFRGSEPDRTEDVLGLMTIYRAPSGAEVFAAGTLRWQRGLGNGPLRDDRARQMTKNLLDRFTGGSDPGPVVASVSDVTVTEGQSASLTVSLSRATAQDVQVGLSTTTGGSATQGLDFWGTSTRLTIPAGQTSATTNVTTLDDTTTETTETIRIQIYSPVNATIEDRYSNISIQDNDSAAVVASVPDITVTEGQTATVTVRLSRPAGQDVHVELSTTDGGSATPGSDYWGTYQRLNIPAGQTSAATTVSTIDDTAAEASETIRIQIFGPVNAAINDRYSTISIQDND